MKMRLRVLIVFAAFGATACTTGDPPSTLVPIPVTPTNITETFTGTVAVGGNDIKSFTARAGGTVSVTLTAAGPPPTVSMGLGIGTLSGTTCSLLTGGSTIAQAGTTPQLTGTIAAGSYCIAVVAQTGQTGTVAYSVTVVHT